MDNDPGGPGTAAEEGASRGWAMPALVFVTSAAVLVLEILAGRMVAPYVGVSLETYTGIIGTVLAGIAVGSGLGGRVADRHEPRLLLGPLLVLAGSACLMALPIVAGLGPEIAAAGGGPAGIIVLTLAAFALPSALLSAVAPMAAKLRLASTAQTGTVVGGLSAAGTAGALVGTFATGFVFLAAVPTGPIVIGVGLALIATGIGVSIRLRGSGPRPAVVVALVVVAGVAQAVPSPCQRQTRYYCVTVVTDTGRPSGRTLVLDNLRHSYVDLEDPTYLEFRYIRLFAAVVEANLGRDQVDTLHIGGGGFTLPRWLDATRPSSTNTVLELDPELVTIAQSDLGLLPDPNLRVRTGDARISVKNEPAGAYDLVVGDAFGGLSVPWHLTTIEMVAEIERVMRPGALYVLNIIDGSPRRLVRAELATLERAFDHVAVILPPDRASGNHVLVASNRPIRTGSVPARDGVVLGGDDVTRLVSGAEVLRDDFAPADQLMSRE